IVMNTIGYNRMMYYIVFFFFFQAEDGIRDERDQERSRSAQGQASQFRGYGLEGSLPADQSEVGGGSASHARMDKGGQRSNRTNAEPQECSRRHTARAEYLHLRAAIQRIS